MTSLPPLRRMLAPNSIVLGEPTKSIAAAAPATGRLHDLVHRIGRGVVDGCYGAHLAGMRALLCIDVGNDHLTWNRGRRDVHCAAADAACADDQHLYGHFGLLRLTQRG